MILLPFAKFICREGMSVNIIILNIYHNYIENEYARRILFLMINKYNYYFDYIDSTVHLYILLACNTKLYYFIKFMMILLMNRMVIII